MQGCSANCLWNDFLTLAGDKVTHFAHGTIVAKAIFSTKMIRLVWYEVCPGPGFLKSQMGEVTG